MTYDIMTCDVMTYDVMTYDVITYGVMTYEVTIYQRHCLKFCVFYHEAYLKDIQDPNTIPVSNQAYIMTASLQCVNCLQ